MLSFQSAPSPPFLVCTDLTRNPRLRRDKTCYRNRAVTSESKPHSIGVGPQPWTRDAGQPEGLRLVWLRPRQARAGRCSAAQAARGGPPVTAKALPWQHRDCYDSAAACVQPHSESSLCSLAQSSMPVGKTGENVDGSGKN
jgi:hypothetical protein